MEGVACSSSGGGGPSPLHSGSALPEPGAWPHLGGGPIHPAFRTGVHIDEDEALHHLGVVQLRFKNRGERDNLGI